MFQLRSDSTGLAMRLSALCLRTGLGFDCFVGSSLLWESDDDVDDVVVEDDVVVDASDGNMVVDADASLVSKVGEGAGEGVCGGFACVRLEESSPSMSAGGPCCCCCCG